MHFGNAKDVAQVQKKFGMLKPARESEAVIFWVKALRADL